MYFKAQQTLREHQIPLVSSLPFFQQDTALQSKLNPSNLRERLQKLLRYSPSSEEPEPEPKNRHRGRAQRQNTGRRARNLESLRPGISIRGKEEEGGGGDEEYMRMEDGEMNCFHLGKSVFFTWLIYHWH